MTTTADLLSETRRHLESYRRTPMNQLNAAIDATATTLTFTHDVSQIQAGAYLEIGLELVYVWTVDQGGKTATVQRGQAGSTAVAHTAGSVVTVNPPFPDFAILKAVNDDLLSLASPINGLYAVRSVDLTATANSSGYDLAGATDLLEILDIRHKHAGAPRTWSAVTNFELHRNTSADDFPSGLGLTLSEGVRPGQAIRVLYKASFDPLTTLADDVETVAGLPASMHDIPPLGAAMRLVAPREIRRNQIESQGDSRRAEEVPPGALGSALRGLAALRQIRISEEASSLAQRFPDRGFLPLPPAGVW